MNSTATSRPRRWLSAAAHALLLACLVAGFHLPDLVTGRVPLSCDARASVPWWTPGEAPPRPQDVGGLDKVLFTLPNVVRWKRAVAQRDWGTLLWNPDILCGNAPLGGASHTLYPLNAVFMVVDDPLCGLQWSTIIHQWLAALFASWLLMSLGFLRRSALVGGLAYSLSPWMVAHLDIVNFIQVATWIPLFFHGLVAVSRGRLRRGLLVGSFGLAMAWLGGMPQIVVLSLLLAGSIASVWLLRVVVRQGWRIAWRRAWGLAGVVLFGVALAAPQILPLLTNGRESHRWPPSKEVASIYSVPAASIAETALPLLFGCAAEVDRLVRSGELPAWANERNFLPAASFDAGAPSLIERVHTPGTIGLLLILLALTGRRWRVVLASLAVAGIAFCVSLGPIEALQGTPWISFGPPARWLFLVHLAQSFLVTLGAEEFFRSRLGPRRFLPPVAASVLALLFVNSWVTPGLWESVFKGSESARSLVEAQKMVLPAWMRRVALGPLMASLLLTPLVLASLRRRRGAVGLVLLVLIAGDAFWFHHRCNPSQPRAGDVHETPVIRWVRDKLSSEFRMVRFFGPKSLAPWPPFPSNLSARFGIREVQGYDALLDRGFEDLANTVEPGLAQLHRRIHPLRRSETLASPLLDLMAARYVMASEELPLPVVYRSPGEMVAVYERATALPRWRIPRRLEVFDSREELRQMLERPEYDPARSALLLRDDARKLGMREGELEGAARCELIEDGCARIRFRCRSERGFVLALADRYHPSWSARLKAGKKLALVRCDLAFRAVALPAGEHELIMEFEARDFVRGSALACAALLFLLFVALPRARRDPVGGLPARGAEELGE